jgi:hypothetical protein
VAHHFENGLQYKRIVISFVLEKWKGLNCGSERVWDRLKEACFERGKENHITHFSYSGEGNICCAWWNVIFVKPKNGLL